jgi:HEAT repeat protein
MTANPFHHGRPPLRERAIEELVLGLDNLRWNLQVQTEILTLGQDALPALVGFLQRPPSQFPEGRVLAAEALGRIGGEAAFQCLLGALRSASLRDLEPVTRLAEEAVQNAIARELGRIGDLRAVPTLIDALRTRRLIGAADALVHFHEASAIPLLIDGLEDAFKRDHFASSVQAFGPRAIPFLADTLVRRRAYAGQELRPSLERRATAVQLLARLDAGEATEAIRTALSDCSDLVRTEAALALVVVKLSKNDLLEAVPALLVGLTHSDFIQRDRCAEALMQIGPCCLPLLHQAIAQGGVIVDGEAIPLTVNARRDLLRVLECTKEPVAC